MEDQIQNHSPKSTVVQINLIFLVMIMGLPNRLSSQCESPFEPSPFCESAPLICFNQACFTTSNVPITCCNNWCGNNTIINNPQYFPFIAAESDVNIEIHVDHCSNGTGLQCGIVDACPWDNSNILNCNPGTLPGGTMVLNTSGLIPGFVYWLLIDGSNGATCQYTVTSVEGIEPIPLVDSLESSLTYAEDTLVCQGYWDLMLTTGPVIYEGFYKWTLGWNGQVIQDSSPTIYINIGENSPPGVWNICVRAFSGCGDSTNQICIPITIGTIPPVIKDSVILCPEAFPFNWNGQVIPGPGDYTASFIDSHGCSYDSSWNIQEYPEYPHGIMDTLVCELQFVYGGQIFDHSGQYQIVLPGANINGCDSIVDVQVTIGASDQFVEVACENNEMVLKTHITAQDESIDTVTFEWYSCAFDSLLSTAANFFPGSGGCYSLVINSGSCRDTISSSYYNSGCIVNDLCYFKTSPTCAGELTLITPVFEVPGNARIYWLIDYPGAPATYAGNTDSIYVTFTEPGNYLVSYTIVDSSNTWSCHANMQVNTGPEVSICCDQSTCDSCAFITLTNHSTDFADVQLTNGISTSVFGNGNMTIEICSPTGFPATIGIADIESNENGCQGTIIGDTFVTISPLPPALVFIVPFTDTLCTYPNDLASYQWRHCDSTEILSTATCFAPPSSGCYCLDVENEFGCSYETCTDFILNAIPTLSEDQLIISSNPSHGVLQIESEGINDFPLQWQLVNAEGQIVTEGRLMENKSELDFNIISPGIYFLKFNFKSKGVLVRKIVIE